MLLNRPNRIVQYLADASYWVYLFSLSANLPHARAITRLARARFLKVILSTVFITGLLLLVYHRLIRYSALGRALNGVRLRTTENVLWPAAVAGLDKLALYPCLTPVQSISPHSACPCSEAQLAAFVGGVALNSQVTESRLKHPAPSGVQVRPLKAVKRILGLLSATAPGLKSGFQTAIVRLMYSSISFILRRETYSFLNYGYMPLDAGVTVLELQPGDESDRASIQLYNRVAGARDLRGKEILEVGCGRGGGSSFIARYLHPRSVTGIDLSERASVLPAQSRCARSEIQARQR